MNFELIQPWSTFVMKTKLSPAVLDSMLKITDEIIETRESDASDLKAGQILQQYFVDEEILWREQVMDFLMYGCQTYVQQSQKQLLKPEGKWMSRMTLMWINSQYDNEYFPIHVHTNCSIAATMYLKIPEFLPSRQTYEGPAGQDGCIEFINNTTTDYLHTTPNVQFQPQVGDFFIFSGLQRHQVYPFRTLDGKGERRSVSFNTEFAPINE